MPHFPFLQLKGMLTLAPRATCSRDVPGVACTFLPPLNCTVTVAAALAWLVGSFDQRIHEERRARV